MYILSHFETITPCVQILKLLHILRMRQFEIKLVMPVSVSCVGVMFTFTKLAISFSWNLE